MPDWAINLRRICERFVTILIETGYDWRRKSPQSKKGALGTLDMRASLRMDFGVPQAKGEAFA